MWAKVRLIAFTACVDRRLLVEHYSQRLEASEAGAVNVTIDLRAEPNRLVISVHGELDLHAVPRLLPVLDSASEHAANDVLVDFSDCDFFDALTVSLLVRTARRLRTGNRRLTVTGLSAAQEAVLRICGLQRIATIS